MTPAELETLRGSPRIGAVVTTGYYETGPRIRRGRGKSRRSLDLIKAA
jgi:hypothetical protein